MKWEPLAAMLALVLLGFWLVWGPSAQFDLREGASSVPFRVGSLKGQLEILDQDEAPTFRVLYRDGTATDVLTQDQFRAFFGESAFGQVMTSSRNPVMRLFNITSWTSLVWIAIGLLGQGAFFARMFIQWMVSEKQRQSVVPEVFWWFSLIGGIALFAYFAWRQDIVGVLGQTSGVVIYARNIRLIHKRKRRDIRDAEKARRRAAREARLLNDPAPEPILEGEDREVLEVETRPISHESSSVMGDRSG